MALLSTIAVIISLSTLSTAQSVTVPGLPTSLAATATPVSAISSLVASVSPTIGLGDPFSLSSYPACAVSCNNDVNLTVTYDTNNIQLLCSADYRSRTSACEKVTCSSSDYDKSQTLGAEICGTLYNNNTALASSVSSAIASATAFAASAVAGKDPTQPSSYPPCASSCQTQTLANSGSGCTSLSDRECVCTNRAFLEALGVCETAKCSLTDRQITTYIGDQLCDPVGGIKIGGKLNATNATTSGSPTPTPATFTGVANGKEVQLSALFIVAMLGGIAVL